MKQVPITQHLYIDVYSATPKYLQLANSIIKAIAAGKIQKNDVLPSINEISFEFEISRDTAEKGYKYLRSLGILSSVPGKGYFVQNTQFEQKFTILLLFNKLSEHKKIIYDSFVDTIGEHANIDFYIYNSDFSLFKNILTRRPDEYTHFVILPHFRERWENVHDVLNTLPKEKLVLLDKRLEGVTGSYRGVYENFEQDIYTALEQAKEKLEKYKSIKIIFPENTYYPDEILQGFKRFCQDYAFNYEIISNIEKEAISPGNIYINLRENDLVVLLEKIIAQNLVVGEDVGIISYNETPLKKLILNGLTTISTDFKKMGELAAELILTNSFKHIDVPFYLTPRSSL